MNGRAGGTQGGKLNETSARLFEPVSLDDYMSEDEIRRLAEALCKVIEHGFGQVTVEINNGHVRSLIVTESHLLARMV